MNFQGLAKKSTKTEKNDKGRFKRKKHFGKSIGNRAPSMLLGIIDRKLSYYGKSLIKIDTWSAKASQFNHFDGTYNKKKLSQRWNNFNGIKVQRDLYSAFLIMNVAEDLKSFDMSKCNERYYSSKYSEDCISIIHVNIEKPYNQYYYPCIVHGCSGKGFGIKFKQWKNLGSKFDCENSVELNKLLKQFIKELNTGNKSAKYLKEKRELIEGLAEELSNLYTEWKE